MFTVYKSIAGIPMTHIVHHIRISGLFNTAMRRISSQSFTNQSDFILNIWLTVSCDIWIIIAIVRRYPPNPRGAKNAFSDMRLLSIQIYSKSMKTQHLYFRYLSNMDLSLKISFSSDNCTLHIISKDHSLYWLIVNMHCLNVLVKKNRLSDSL